MHYTAHVSDGSDRPPPLSSGTPREALLRMVTAMEAAHDRDQPGERAELIVAISFAIGDSGLPTLEVHRLARFPHGCLQDGSLTLQDLRLFLARVRHLTLP